ncbi:probable ATP-dependent RNA helicase Dbp45A [Ctenocephalides felis]|uniref:probable ATP-dependent RNA helicase Dbp45A n=1 Tax=Ctenocephalides felis TaxID=7515 RepID=UPI000E6E4084|nr:probable ATP-dependent RNA helicase Dbp45A [Ctenocephalides felis]
MEEINEFNQLNLKQWLLNQCEKLGIKKPTPIQQHCIKPILEGQDCIGAAKTGSGKTFAFALPILQKLSDDPYGIFALVLTPTHELAYQIADQFSVLGQPLGVKVCVVAGGTDQLYESQRLAKRPHIVVAMPGRLSDHISGCDTFSLKKIKFLVLDEADRMLSGHFDESLKVIASALPPSPQTLLFSATLNDQIMNSKIFNISQNAFRWTNSSEVATVDTLDQRYLLCADYDREVMLVQLIREIRESTDVGNIIIFTNTKKDCQLLSITLNKIGMENVCLHGFMKQRERLAALAQFRSKTITNLIATDVASRGLDISCVDLVINHKLPKEPKEYIHRVGRTARAGRKGLAISIFRFPRDLPFLGEIEKVINTKITEYKINERAADKIFLQVSVTKREAEISLDNNDFNERAWNYRRKKWIEQGLDPDVMEQEMIKSFKKQRKERLKAQKLENEKNKALADAVQQDERFKDVPKKKQKLNKYNIFLRLVQCHSIVQLNASFSCCVVCGLERNFINAWWACQGYLEHTMQ